jgi:hypothetical protein
LKRRYLKLRPDLRTEGAVQSKYGTQHKPLSDLPYYNLTTPSRGHALSATLGHDEQLCVLNPENCHQYPSVNVECFKPLFLFQNVCKVLSMLEHYCRSTTYFWMLCEGFYLHRLLVNAFVPPKQLIGYYITGWGKIWLIAYTCIFIESE